MKIHNSPSKLPLVEYINECLAYNAYTGVFTWRKRPLSHFKNSHGMNTFNSKYAGLICGSRHNGGYISVNLKNKSYLAHRVAWKIMTGRDPKYFIDHIDGDKANNTYSNLRLASKQQNAYNCGKSAANKTGFKGVSFDSQRNKYYACINVNGKTTSLGRHNTPQLAHAAYIAAAKNMHGDFLRTK